MLKSKSIRCAGIALAAMIGAVSVPAAAHATTFATETLGPRAETSYNLPLNAWQSGTVSIRGSGMSDLDLFVYDENNTLVCQSIGISDEEACDLLALSGQTARVTVRNLGYASNTFVIAFE